MLDLKKLINYCFIEITSEEDINKIEYAKSKYKLDHILCLFFHYNIKSTLNDCQLINTIEEKTKMNINWIDISKLYEETIKINNSLGLYISNNKSEKYNKNVRNKIILKDIKNYFKENLLKYKNYTEI